MYKIRKTKEVEKVKKIFRQIFPEDDWYESPGNHYWLVFSDKEVIGFCSSVDCRLKEKSNKCLFLSFAGLLKKARGKGLHKRMLKVRENHAKKIGLNDIVTYCIPDNWSSISNLIKNNYKVYEPEYDWVGQNVLYFHKKLK